MAIFVFFLTATRGSRLHSQAMPNRFYYAMKNQTSWLITDNRPDVLFNRNWNPIRPLALWNNNRIIKSYLTPFIERMLKEGNGDTGVKTILGLAIDAYKQGKFDNKELDATFYNILLANLKIFMVAGHDTTASILGFTYYLLSTNPSVLEAVRREHDAVFGSDVDAAMETILDSPTLLNQLPYTMGVIKETLRLFPPFGSVREGSAEDFLTHPNTGKRYPTHGFLIFSCSAAVHRLEEFWPEPRKCIPERWIVPEGDPLHPYKGAFRPFELGPRNCIGQEMAMLELRIILAMTAREFDFECQFPPDRKAVFGELSYQTQKVGQLSAYPKDAMPARVKLAKSR